MAVKTSAGTSAASAELASETSSAAAMMARLIEPTLSRSTVESCVSWPIGFGIDKPMEHIRRTPPAGYAFNNLLPRRMSGALPTLRMLVYAARLHNCLQSQDH